MFERGLVHMCTWYQATLGQRLVIDFVVISSGDLGAEPEHAGRTTYPSGLGKPRGSPGGAGKCSWGEGYLGFRPGPLGSVT